MASFPAALMLFTSSFPASSLRSRITIFAPSPARYEDIVRPRIPAAPVITTTLSFTLNRFAIIVILSFKDYCFDNSRYFL